MISNITIIGPRCIGKSTLCRNFSSSFSYDYVELDQVIDKYLAKQGGLKKAITDGNLYPVLNIFAPRYISDILNHERIILELSAAAISSKFTATNQKNLRNITSKSYVAPLLYSHNFKESVNVLVNREMQNRFAFKENSRESISYNYKRFLEAIEKNELKPFYCINKTVDKLCLEIFSKVSK